MYPSSTITYDTLVRAGVSVQSAFVPDTINLSKPASPPAVKGSRGIRILPDLYFEAANSGPAVPLTATSTLCYCHPKSQFDLLYDVLDMNIKEKYDALIIPGGAKGAETLSSSSQVQALVREYIDKKKFVGMICAGSLAALTSGLPKQPLTSHPSVKLALESNFDYSDDPVVVSGNLVTSRGPGTAFPFALKLVELLCGPEKRKEVHGPMMFPTSTPW
ncbi:class I glutamine amidotransferase-like protein [Dendrothele bispora CBS 962.96]|uniref:D-lactate dehydratase n=1 Tax=Dendrothele bispora (strain CBS 962.96) TaxID=1314807 RepID=A0A4S8MP79_DENBC|nr:class I glutamine amidotransferase-like protein [Dendrothele bispora CBS 962.96]